MIFLAVMIASTAVFSAPALADWSVTVTWTRSAGPGLDYEEVLYSGASQCTVDAASATTCNFVTANLGGQVVVRSFNSQGAYADTAAILLNDVPAPASGVNINVTYVAP